ncbi:MAG TPA: XdhC/CoxI family protein [Thermodesulfobacteriota bacterium]|nr:XdhC/CoxI family protein [Thermodesulfobacteriota bacterium]
MHEVFEQLEQLRRSETRVALATLVDTRGTTPRKEGAKMWVGAGGRILGSVTIGGCVDARVIEEAEAALAKNAPRLLEVHLGAEEAWEIGLSCGGTVELLIEPLALAGPGSPALDYYARLRAHAERGGCGALVSNLDRPGAGKLLLLDDGTREGSLGDPALDARAAAAAQELMRRGASRTVTLEGGRRVFVEAYGPPPVLVVVGATHVAMPLTGLAKVLGYRTVVVDGRPRFGTRERFPDADEVRVGMPSELVKAVPMTPATAVVLLAHDHKYDLPVLRYALTTPAGYIGMLGSRRRGAAILKLLREEGVPEEALARVRVPIGLDLGGESAQAIALAIMAEIVAVRQGGSGLPMREAKGGAGAAASGSAGGGAVPEAVA